ncbi:hypothetical protein ILUMI_25389 [Ignelater luminosus]|uniref:Uncharacterized protein n=1 Tax=Ignelater luminosus TaxID=2038154 RepID=A0A8K0C8M2_IGNLU|nr:hypothetical protein ILUMI_25389 [Ignelater luminosus]
MVSKKLLYGTLKHCPYIDYRDLNKVTKKEMFPILRTVFDRLRTANVKLKPSKCVFLKPKVKYLGHIIPGNGIQADPDKLQALKLFLFQHQLKRSAEPITNKDFQEIKDSLWDYKENIAFAHCVSENFSMAKGIALGFKKKFGFLRQLLAQRKKTWVTQDNQLEGEDEEQNRIANDSETSQDSLKVDETSPKPNCTQTDKEEWTTIPYKKRSRNDNNPDNKITKQTTLKNYWLNTPSIRNRFQALENTTEKPNDDENSTSPS